MPPEILEIQPHNNGTSHFCETEIEPLPYKRGKNYYVGAGILDITL